MANSLHLKKLLNYWKANMKVCQKYLMVRKTMFFSLLLIARILTEDVREDAVLSTMTVMSETTSVHKDRLWRVLQTWILFTSESMFSTQNCLKYRYFPYNPQPAMEEMIYMQRYYTKLKKNNTYEKRVTWLEPLHGLDTPQIAVVEYKFHFQDNSCIDDDRNWQASCQ